jgi:hypothetical protein
MYPQTTILFTERLNTLSSPYDNPTVNVTMPSFTRLRFCFE